MSIESPGRIGFVLLALLLLGRAAQAQNHEPVCATPTPITTEDTPLVFRLIADDPDGDPLHVMMLASAVRGTFYQVKLDGTKGDYIDFLTWVTHPDLLVWYEPAPDASGQPYEFFSFEAFDSSELGSGSCALPIDVLPVNDPPVARPVTFAGHSNDPYTEMYLQAFDTERSPLRFHFTRLPTWGTIYARTVADGNAITPDNATHEEVPVIYVPTAFYRCSGLVDSFAYFADDGELHSDEVEQKVVIQRPSECPPVLDIRPLTATTDGAEVKFQFDARDLGGSVEFVSLLTLPQHGQLFERGFRVHSTPFDMFGSGILTYVPAPGSSTDYAGPFTFEVQAYNGQDLSSIVEVGIWISTRTPGVPWLDTISDEVLGPGGADVIVTVTGAGFTPASEVTWNGRPLVTTWHSATELSAVISADLIARATAAEVRVTTPAVLLPPEYYQPAPIPDGWTCPLGVEFNEQDCVFVPGREYPPILVHDEHLSGGGTSNARFIQVSDVPLSGSMIGSPLAWIGTLPNATVVEVVGRGNIGIAQFAADPTATSDFDAAGPFFRVQFESGADITALGLYVCELPEGVTVMWFDGSAWVPVSPQGYQDEQRCMFAFLDESTTPRVSQLGNAVFGIARVNDATGPLIVPHVAGEGGTNWWFTGDVTISWTVTDPESPISSTSDCGVSVLVGNTPATPFTCTATSGGGTASATVVVGRDDTAPLITPRVTGTMGEMNWFIGDVDVTWTVVDPESPVSATTGCEDVHLTTDTIGTLSITCEATSTRSISRWLAIKRDTTPPETAFTSTPEVSMDDLTVRLAFSGDDGFGSGVMAFECRLDGGSYVPCTTPHEYEFGAGSHVVAVRAIDRQGLQDPSPALFRFSGPDTAPVLTLPSDIAANATGPEGAAVTFAATATDDIDGSVDVTCSPASGSTFALGTTTVTCSATDVAHHVTEGEFDVVVSDTTAPAITYPAENPVAEASGPMGAAVSFDVTASDAVDGVVAVSCFPASGDTFPLGHTLVKCNADDAAGNRGTAGFFITVRDTTGPTIAAPADVTVEAAGPFTVVTYDVTAMDLVDGPVTPRCGPGSGASLPLGLTTVICSVEDAAGNVSRTRFPIVVQDTTAPEITVPTNIAVDATSASGAMVAYRATASDLVDGAVPPGCTPVSGSLFPIGNTTVTCEATDSQGNAAAPKTFNVQVRREIGSSWDQLAALVAGVGPGKSLAAKVRAARGAYATGDMATSCSGLASLLSEVRAQTGRQVSAAQAAAITTLTNEIRAMIGC